MAETIYLRNLRPNRVIVTYADLRVPLERRGAREDTTSMPADARNEPTIARWLRSGIIEEISKESFLTLAARTDAYDPNYRGENEPAVQTDIRKAALPMVQDPRQPETVDIDKIDRQFLTPRNEFVTKPEPTRSETSDNLAPQEVEVHDYHRGATGRPENLALEDEVALAQQSERPAVKKATPRKRATTTKKKTTTRRKSTN